MAAEVVRDLADTIIGNKDTVEAMEAMELDLESNPSVATVILVDDAPLAGFEKLNTEEPSGYTLTCESGYSRDVDRWMRGDSPVHTPLSTPSGDSALPSGPQQVSPSAYSGLRYITTALSSLSDSVRPEWISWYQENGTAGRLWVKYMTVKLKFEALLSKLEGAVWQAGCLCLSVRSHVRRLAEERALREVFAAAMDIVLVAYAVGFLLLSLCQASLVSF